jgi:hypothetical protein
MKMPFICLHPKFGIAVIERVLPGVGRTRVKVNYPDLMLIGREVFLDELMDSATGRPPVVTEAAEDRTHAATPTEAQPERRKPPSWQEARQAILALRLGQSTPLVSRELNVCMEMVDAAMQSALDKANSGQVSFLIFVSEFGMGKSHALSQLRLQAIKRKMAVGSVVLDGMGVSLCQPMSLPSTLTHAIELGDHGEGLSARLSELVRTRQTSRLHIAGADLLFSALSALTTEHVDDPEAWELLEDYLSLDVAPSELKRRLNVNVPPLKTRSRADRPDRCALLMRDWARSVPPLGHPGGLVLLLDEADVDFALSGRIKSESEQRAALLQAWRAMADGGPGGSSHAKLLIALAVTPAGSIDDPGSELCSTLGPCARVVQLPELSDDHLRELGQRIAAMYARAYQTNPEARATEFVDACLQKLRGMHGRRNPRHFIRMLLEKLDAAHV